MVMVICICLNYFVILIYCIFFNQASRKQHVLQFAIEMEDLTLVKLLCDGGADVNILVLVHDYFVVSLLISKRDNISLKWLQYSYNMSIKIWQPEILKEQEKLSVFHEFLNCHICSHYLLTVFPTHFLN